MGRVLVNGYQFQGFHCLDQQQQTHKRERDVILGKVFDIMHSFVSAGAPC